MTEDAGSEPLNIAHSRLVRALDGIAYGLLAVAVIVCHPELGRTWLGDLSNLHLLPLAGMAVATYALPAGNRGDSNWHGARWRLRVAVLLALGLNPFISWWVRSVDNVYLLLTAAAAMFASVWYLLELAVALRVLLHSCGSPKMEMEARIARVLILYFIMIPTTAVHVSFAGALLMFPGTALSDLLRTWSFVPSFVRGLMLLAVLHVEWLLWRTHRVVLARRPEL